MPEPSHNLTRRELLQRSLAAGAAAAVPWFVSSRALGLGAAAAASERITLGVIGIGPRATYDLGGILPQPDVQCVAICDVQASRREAGKKLVDERYGNKDCALYCDLRELLARPDIDAVGVATSVGGHHPVVMAALAAGKHVFCEKPIADAVDLGWQMVRKAAETQRILAVNFEMRAAQDSGQVLLAEDDGEITSVTGDRIVLSTDDGRVVEHHLRRFRRSNQSTCVDQRPIVYRGERVVRGQPLADSSSTKGGELALGHNVLVAFMSWEGGNYEDAILISEELVRDDKYSSIHIEKHEIEARDTKLGPEEITRDIPNVGEEALKDLDEEGIVRIGAEVGPGDILVGKITPKGETELTPEEKLLRAIFGEKAREVKDSSLRLPHGEKGKVVDVKIFTREEHRDLPAGVDKMVRVSVAQRRKLTAGDKMSGRHGNKGVVSRIVPVADMPFLGDGTPVQIILNPLGVPGRMNIGQIMEVHLGWAADRLGFQAVTPYSNGASEREIAAELGRAYMMDHAWHEVRDRAWEWPRRTRVSMAPSRTTTRCGWSTSPRTTRLCRRPLLTDRAYSREAVLRSGYASAVRTRI